MKTENILKKALSEAMTERYSAELLNASEPKHEYSESFNIKMRNLIIKTDNPFIKYTKYLAVAACAVLAIGCTFLIPVLTGNGIHTGEADAPAVNETIGIPESFKTESAVTTETVPETTPVTTRPPETAAQEEAATDSKEDTVVPAVTEMTQREEAAAPQDAPQDSSQDAPAVEDFEEIVTDEDDNDNPGTGADNRDPDSVGESFSDIPVIEEDDVVADDEADFDIDEDIVLEDEIECEDDDVVTDGEEEVVEEETEDRPVFPEAKTFSELYRLIYSQEFLPEEVRSKNYSSENAKLMAFSYGAVSSCEKYTDFSFVKEFIGKLGTAKATEMTSAEKDYATIRINPEASAVPYVYYCDDSFISRYDGLFRNELDDVDEDEPAEELGELASAPDDIELHIYRTGLMSLQFVKNAGTEWFIIPDDIVSNFFAGVDNMFIETAPSTVGGFITDRNISEANICRSYANVNYVYDYKLADIDLKGNKKLITDFLNANKDKALIYIDVPNDIYDMGITFGLKDSSSVIELAFIDFNTAVLRAGRGDWYRFSIEKAQFDSLFKELLKLCGYSNPVLYDNLGQYLSDKNFSEITKLFYSGNIGEYKLLSHRDGEALGKIAELIKTEAPKAEYTLDGVYSYGDFELNVMDWGFYYKGFTISSEGHIHILRNKFRVSDSFINKLTQIIKESGSASENSYDIEDDVPIIDEGE